MDDRVVTCRYLKSYNTQCTAEAVAADAEIILCSRHLAAAQRAIHAAYSRVGAQGASRPASGGTRRRTA